MGTLQTWRKAYGALKDQTKLGLAHVNSDFKDVDVAIAKATNHVERPPKERHIRKILAATSAVRPRADVAYCIHTLSRRLAKTHNWTVALKTLIVIHRTLREGDPTFREEVLNFQQRGRFLQMSNFKDDSSPIAWDCSAWVRTYALFLEERLECFRILNYDIESERLGALAQDKGYSKTRDLDSEKLLEHVPALQQLLFRLIGCRPEGAAAAGNYVIQYALSFVLKESFKIYCAINDGIINLVDKFFEMPRHEAIKALDIYRRAGQQAISLSDFYEICKGLELARNFQFPVLKEPPQSFLVTMEEYIKEAPRMFSVPSVALEYPERLMLTYKEEDVPTPYDETKVPLEEFGPPPSDEVLTPTAKTSVNPTNLDMDDLLGLNAITEDASGNYNGLDLAIVPLNSEPYQANDFDPNGWELALVTTPSTTSFSSDQERQLAGGLDSLTLNSLYDESAYRSNQQPVYGRPAPNPFEVRDPFAVPNITPRPQTAAAAAAAPFNMVHQNNPFDSFQPIYPQTQQQQHTMVSSQNPFGDVRFMATSPAAPSQTNNPFGGPGAL